LLAGCDHKTAAVAPPTAVTVTVSTPIEREVFDYEDFTGRTEAVESVEIRARVTGYLEKICFKEGSEVNQGDLLFEIDPRPFKARYDQVTAQIKVREANVQYRQAELARGRALLPQNAISQSDFDQMAAAYAEAVASVTAAEASAEEAKLNLDFTRIASPIAGRISRASITEGNLVRADDTLLTTVVSVDPMYAYFDVNERTILRIGRNVRQGKIQARDGEKIPVLMALADDEAFPHQGTIDFADNRVDPGTGTIRVRGVFPNPKPDRGNRVLMPGLFARLRVPIGEPYKALMVTERAVGTDQGQKYLLVVNEQGRVEYRRVRVGRLEDGLRVIKAGLHAGERVIVSGLQRVRPGVPVESQTVDMASFSLSARPKAKPAEPAAGSSQTPGTK
jgi:RND family efflux transporter MFP subunit